VKKAVIYYGGFLSKSGGAFFHASNLEAELIRQGWAVEVITLDNLPIWCRYLPHLISKGINFFYAPFGFLYKASLTKMLYKIYFDKKTNLRVFEDIYLAWNSLTPTITMLHAVWSDNLQAFSITDKRLKTFLGREAKLINQIAHPLVTVSYPYRDYINRQHFAGSLVKKINVIELGVDQSIFNTFGKADHMEKSIVYCGALEPRKNVSFLLEVFKKIYASDPEYSLTIIGDGPDRALLKSFASKHQLPVNFLGRLTNDDALAELHKHEIYVHTSVKESFSYSLLEAKLAGLTTVAYSKLQIPEEFIDVGIDSFHVEDWYSGIINSKHSFNKFDGSKFKVEKMTQATLNLIGVKGR